MGEFVDDHVVAGAGHLRVVPGNDQRPALPGFAGEHVVEFMDDAALVLDAPGNDELVGVDDYPDPVAVGGQAKLEDRQAALGGDRDTDFVAQFEAAGDAEFLFGEEAFDQRFEGFFLVDRKCRKEGQGGQGSRPQFLGNCRLGLVAEPVEEAHHFLMVSQMPVKIRPMPR